MALNGKGISISVLVLRILTLLLSVACVVVFVLNTHKNADGSKQTFNSVFAFRYVLSTDVIGAFYSLLQLPFTIYFVYTEKKLISVRFLSQFDFYGDKVICFLWATGVGAGFGITFKFKKFLNDIFESGFPVEEEDSKSPIEKFLVKSYIATGLLLGAFICMAVLSVISSVNRKTSSGYFSGIFKRKSKSNPIEVDQIFGELVNIWLDSN